MQKDLTSKLDRVISSRQNTALATLMIIVSACSFGSLSTLTVLVTREGMSLGNALFWRYAIALVVLLAVIRDISRLRIGGSSALRLMVVSGVGQTIITYTTLSALRYIEVGSLAFLFYTYPAWMAIIAAATKIEPLTIVRSIALLLALAGLGVMLGTPMKSSLNQTGVMLALGAAFLYSLYLPAIEKAQRNIEPMVSAFYLVLGVTITFFVLSLVQGGITPPRSLTVWGYVVLLAIVCTVLAFRTLIGGLRVLGPVRTSIVSTIEPFFTLSLGAAALGEKMTGNIVMGGILIAGAVLLLHWREKGPSLQPLQHI